VCNNQVGFTTDPIRSRSTPYCTDIAKGFGAPVFHVNGDDVFAVVQAFEMAAEYRNQWGTDVFIDLICYRRMGHNEADNPEFTQPQLYETIRKHPSVEEIAARYAVEHGFLSEDQIAHTRAHVRQAFEANFEAAKNWDQSMGQDAIPVLARGEHSLATPVLAVQQDPWSHFSDPNTLTSYKSVTALDLDVLKDIGRKLCEVPEGFNIHRNLKRQLAAKRETIESGEGIDWGTAEALAFGSLLLEGTHVRLTGQDVERGTFSHRHCLVHDQRDGRIEHVFLNTLAPKVVESGNLRDLQAPGVQARFTVRNSILSELAVLGFEYGYASQSPYSLNLWEAQFGDFSNGCQMMLDQFISAGEHKWTTQNGLVMLLPHGYEGQGSEHSSCRLERYLQMVDDDEDDVFDKDKDGNISDDEVRLQVKHTNWSVCNLTTPANYFHLLRLQIHRDFRKPLVVASPKSLLRHPACKSSLADMAFGGKIEAFERAIDERNEKIDPAKVTRLIFCSGKIYYQLVEEREKLGLDHIAVCTVEQLAPFPFDLVAKLLQKYPGVDPGDGLYPGDIVWCQEEPKNMGPWPYVKPRLVASARDILSKDIVFRYAGRRAAASPATGLGGVHVLEQNKLVKDALGVA